MISLPSRPDETFHNDYTRRPALGERQRQRIGQGLTEAKRIRQPDALLNVFFTLGCQECARYRSSNKEICFVYPGCLIEDSNVTFWL
jgi:hypothetical protein